jgi:hypothetical protein
MKMLVVRITARVLSVTLFASDTGPNLAVKNKIVNPNIFFKFFKNNCTVYP